MESISIREFQEVRLTQKEERILKRLEPSLPKDFFSLTKKGAKFRHYAGVLSLGSKSIEILPKIEDQSPNGSFTRDALVHMLSVTRTLKTYSMPQAGLSTQGMTLLDVFIKQYLKLLEREISQGLLKIYKLHHEELIMVKGKINLPEQLKHNPWEQTKFYCSYDVFSEDNPYNKLIKSTLIELRSLTANNLLMKDIEKMLVVFEAVEVEGFSLQDTVEIQNNRFTHRYQEILKLSRFFLEGRFIDVTAGGETFGAILFNMNRLFEDYVTYLVKKASRKRGLKAHAQKPQEKLVTEVNQAKNYFQLRPDITIFDQQRKKMLGIVDAKWKELNDSKAKYNIRESDMYQMTAYAKQYQIKNLALVYPSTRSFKIDPPEFKFRQGGERIIVWFIDLASIPNDKGRSVEVQVDNLLDKMFD